jgi:spartin
MIVGKVKTADGTDADIVVGGGDGGVVPINDMHKGDGKNTVSNPGPYGTYGPETSAPSVVGFGNAAPPPSYSTGGAGGSGVGESIEGQRVGGGYANEKSGAGQPQWR